MNRSDLEFIYVGDPMCSWCWGFAPTLEQLEQRYTIPVRTVVGGLRPGPDAEPLNEPMRQTLGHHWEQVQGRSGQPFDRSVLEWEDWVYDTELPCRAVVVMRELAPASTLSFFARVQRAFYAEATDITDPEVYPKLVADYPVDATTFMEQLTSDASKDRAWQDFTEARRMGVAGFPALLLGTGDGLVMITRGYLPYETLEPAVTAWLGDQYPEEIEGLVCEIGEVC